MSSISIDVIIASSVRRQPSRISINFNRNLTSEQVIGLILNSTAPIETNTPEPVPSILVLYHSSSNQWLQGFQTLQSIGVNDKEPLELRQIRDCWNINICMVNTVKPTDLSVINKNKKTFRVDYTEPLNNFIPNIMKLFQMKSHGKEDYCFRKIRLRDEKLESVEEFVNSNLSLREYGMEPDAYMIIFPLSLLMERTLSSIITTPQTKEGWMSKYSIKGSKQTSHKKRWCILEDHFLYYFAEKKPSSKPNGVINLEYFSSEFNNKEIKITMDASKFNFRGGMNLGYCFFGEDEKDSKEWNKKILHQTTNGAKNMVFGVSLQRIFARELDLPIVIRKTISYFSNPKNIETEGIFRVPGTVTSIEYLRDEFDKGKNVILDDSEPHSVAALMKLFLRELPEPILTYNLYENFMDEYYDINDLKTLVHSLPTPNSYMLEAMLNFMFQVSEHSSHNKMDLDAIATVFAPNLLRRKHETADSLMKESRTAVQVVMALVENRSAFKFKKPSREREVSIRHMTFSKSSANLKNSFFSNPPSLSSSTEIPSPSFNNSQIYSVNLPSLTVPSLTVPSLTVPSLTVPSLTVPLPSMSEISPLDNNSAISPPIPQPIKINNHLNQGKCIYDFQAKSDQEIDIKIGDIITIICEMQNGWIKVKLNEKVGLVPESYITRFEGPSLTPKILNIPPLESVILENSTSENEVEHLKMQYQQEKKKALELEKRIQELTKIVELYQSKYGPLE